MNREWGPMAEKENKAHGGGHAGYDEAEHIIHPTGHEIHDGKHGGYEEAEHIVHPPNRKLFSGLSPYLYTFIVTRQVLAALFLIGAGLTAVGVYYFSIGHSAFGVIFCVSAAALILMSLVIAWVTNGGSTADTL